MKNQGLDIYKVVYW